MLESAGPAALCVPSLYHKLISSLDGVCMCVYMYMEGKWKK